jgi:hypothetical protein
MKKYLITMGGKPKGENPWLKEGICRNYTAEANRLMTSAKNYFDKFIIFDNDYIENSSYYFDHKDILSRPSFGAAYKAVCIHDATMLADYGDIILWTDSNHAVISDPQIFFDIIIQNNIFAHDHLRSPYINKHWTLRDTFVNMNCDEERYWNAHHLHANVIGILKNDFGVQFVKEYLKYSLDYKTIVGENKYPNFEGFREHRQDQSIFSILIEKYHIPYYEYSELVIREMDVIKA